MFERNVRQHGDALELMRSLPAVCAPLAFFDPQHRGVLDKLKFGNEGARQRGRACLPSMTEDYIDAVCLEIARALTPSGYLMRWIDTFGLVEGQHLRIPRATVTPVDLIAWDSLRMGMGKRSRRQGDYLLIVQRPPITAKNWRDGGIRSRWAEKVDRSLHPHVKPIGLITRLIGAVTQPGDLVVDPAAGSFVVMRAAHQLGREFIGVDLTTSEGGEAVSMIPAPFAAGTMPKNEQLQLALTAPPSSVLQHEGSQYAPIAGYSERDSCRLRQTFAAAES
jgi:site-specific DNA-methyltransferase (adenine-specific)